MCSKYLTRPSVPEMSTLGQQKLTTMKMSCKVRKRERRIKINTSADQWRTFGNISIFEVAVPHGVVGGPRQPK